MIKLLENLNFLSSKNDLDLKYKTIFEKLIK